MASSLRSIGFALLMTALAMVAQQCEVDDTPPDSNGDPCSFGGFDYAQCFVGVDFGSQQVRIVDRADVLIKNSSVTGVGGGPCVLLRRVDTVLIDNMTVSGCDQSGIRLSIEGGTSNVRIVGGSITDTGRTATANGSCINAGESAGGNPGLVIESVFFDDCGFDDLDHVIYIQTPGYVIRNNDIVDSAGNGISVRSSGLVENNTVRGQIASGKAGIRYFNDHPCGTDGVVQFRNNNVAAQGSGTVDISLLWSSGNAAYACQRYEITGNGPATAVRYQQSSEFDPYDITFAE